MTCKQIEAMKLALEALESLIKKTSGQTIYSFMETERRIAMAACVGLREALAEHQEPIGYLCENAVGHKYFRWKKPSSTYKPIALYK